MEKDCSETSNSMSCLSFLFSARVFGMFRKQTGIGYKASPSLGRIVIYSLTIAICSIAGNRMPAREPPAAPSLVKLSLVRRIQKYPDSLFDILLKFHRANNTSVCITRQLVDCISSFFFYYRYVLYWTFIANCTQRCKEGREEQSDWCFCWLLTFLKFTATMPFKWFLGLHRTLHATQPANSPCVSLTIRMAEFTVHLLQMSCTVVYFLHQISNFHNKPAR